MNAEALDPRWVGTWAAEITAYLQSVLSAFDTYYPFPPGENEVVLAGPDQSPLDATLVNRAASPDLTAFYEVIKEVTMSDIGNGFFIHPPDVVVARLADGPVLLRDGDTGTVFAGNGGGILYAISPDNTVHRSNDASTDSGFEPVATDLRDFLGQVLNAVAHFTATRTPGDL
ncbi:hypothetical protein [Actinoplanes sp. CA-252034]|uniref:hypothetical protein n=1 Tax=Actinoplanes sp. CA-252034 TaxID=3239906 RepID=UPI003D98C317